MPARLTRDLCMMGDGCGLCMVLTSSKCSPSLMASRFVAKSAQSNADRAGKRVDRNYLHCWYSAVFRTMNILACSVVFIVGQNSIQGMGPLYGILHCVVYRGVVGRCGDLQACEFDLSILFSHRSVGSKLLKHSRACVPKVSVLLYHFSALERP